MRVVEKDWITKSGHRAVVLFVRNSHRCGYVGISPKNSLHGKEYSTELGKAFRGKLEGQQIGKRGAMSVFMLAYSESDGVRLDAYFDVHGGLTYSGGSKDYPVESDGLWWFGYDCAHLGDKCRHSEEGVVRTLEYCIDECESLSKQLMEFEADDAGIQ